MFILENKKMKAFKSLFLTILMYGGLLWFFAYFELGMRVLIHQVPLHKIPLDTLVSIFHLSLSFFSLGALFWFLDSPVKKILMMVSIPVNMLSMGLFSIVMHLLIFFLFARVVNQYFSPHITLQLGSLFQVLILSFLMSVSSSFLRKFT